MIRTIYTEEPDAGKLACPVLKTNGNREGVVEFNKEGKATLDLSKDEKLPLPTTVEPLREAVITLLPHVRLADVFIEVDDWVGLRQHFTHLNERQATKTRDPRVDRALFAAILAHGLNLSLTTMAEATDLPYYELVHVSNCYLREDTIR